MSQISIEVSGVNYSEAQELASLLEELEGIESTSVPWKTRDHAHDPDTMGFMIQASAEAQKIVIELGAFFFAQYAGGAFKEMGKEHYLELKKRILRKLGEWRASKPDEQRKRIVFVFDDDQQLVTKEDDKPQDKP